MGKILIFAGTTEGRLLASFCVTHNISAWISVTTSYGETLLPKSPFLQVTKEPMDQVQIEHFLQKNEITTVFDATHPYAGEVTKNSAQACEKIGVTYYRVLRDSLERKKTEGCFGEDMVWVDSAEESVRYLMNRPGRVLVTTGSKELIHFTRLDSFQERVYARVLPTASVLSACETMGFSGSHLIAMQGPFSEALNSAMLSQLSIKYLVTKEAGKAGGFPEKIKAAKSCGIQSVIIGRPWDEKGISLREAEDILINDRKVKKQLRQIFLIGTGMGNQSQMTLQAYEKLCSCQVIFGASRMLDSAKALVPQAVFKTGYASQDIIPWLNDHPKISRTAILYSGDTGFYSGAPKMAEALSLEPYCDWYETEVFPGISSVSYLCSRLKTSWEDVRLVSLHGRKWDILKEVREYNRVFVLTEGSRTIRDLCALFLENGYETMRLTVGERLSYPQERILSGTPKTMLNQEFDSLAAVLIERDLP